MDSSAVTLCNDPEDCTDPENPDAICGNVGGEAKVTLDTEVAIIGNGPASIFLSFLLSGHWPYFTGDHPNPYLQAKLLENMDKSILEQDLEHLSEGLEGYSTNPVALLLDTLLRPNADIGEEHPSSLCWHYDPSRAVSHKVIGRGNPGGSWQYMDPGTQALSLGKLLELPHYSFKDWISENPKTTGGHMIKTDGQPTQGECHVIESGRNKPRRASGGEVAQYYSDYAIKMKLGKHFVGDTEVTQVSNLEKNHYETSPQSSISSSSLSSPLLSPSSPVRTCQSGVMTKNQWEEFTDMCSLISDPEDCGVYCQEKRRCNGLAKRQYKWYLRGIQKSDGDGGNGCTITDVSVFSKKVVLACGVVGDHRRLGVPGEDASFLTHQFPAFAERIVRYSTDSGCVLVVGAGLSAADAILLALEKEMKVVHVFHQDPLDQRLIFNRIPDSMYPEYGRVYKLMQGKEKDPNYILCARSQISEFQNSGFSVSDKNGLKEMWCNVCLGAVLIGTDANLDFLPQNLVPKLGISHELPISAKHNPINKNPFTSVTKASSTMYAVGSLAGDNFVRFCIGSALGAAYHIIAERR